MKKFRIQLLNLISEAAVVVGERRREVVVRRSAIEADAVKWFLFLFSERVSNGIVPPISFKRKKMKNDIFFFKYVFEF